MVRRKPRHSCVGRPPQTAGNKRGTVFVPQRQIFKLREQQISMSLPKSKGLQKVVFCPNCVRHDPHLSQRVQAGLLTSYSWDFLLGVFLAAFPAWLNQSVLRSLNQSEKHFIFDSYVTLQFKRRFIDSNGRTWPHRSKYLISFYFSSGFICCYSAQQHTGKLW